MTISTRKIVITFSVIVVLLGTLWINRYPVRYYYYLWRLNHTTEGSKIIDINEKIELISPHIVPFLVRTYEDVSASDKSRNAAAGGLIKADKNKAETLFITFLQDKDDEVLSTAIFDLSLAKSEKAFKSILPFANNPSDEVRSMVADYLGNFKNEESIALLKRMEMNDQSEKVRNAASNSLTSLGIYLSGEQALEIAQKEAKLLGYDITKMFEETQYNSIPKQCVSKDDSQLKKKLLNRNFFVVYFYPKDKWKLTRSKEICIFIDGETREIIARKTKN